MHVSRFARGARARVPFTVAAAAVVLAGCGSAAGAGEPALDGATSPGAAPAPAMADAWVKASDGGMTAAFGVLVNPGDEDIRVLSAQTPVSATMELHEVVMTDGDMQMRPKAGGFLVPAGGRYALEPGGDHLMIMELTDAIEPGENVEFVLTTDDGSEIEVTAQVKEFTGADEDYEPGAPAGGAGDAGSGGDHDE